MYVVALTELAATLEAEALALAPDLGLTAYEARLLLSPGMPAVVRTTPDKPAAVDLLGRLRARGHGALACDTSAVASSNEMPSMRRFRLGPAGISLEDAAGSVLPYGDVRVMLAAVHRRRASSEMEVQDRKLSVARAVLSGGFVTTRTVSRGARETTEERDPVLYLFRRSVGTPWILREHGTHWEGLDRPLSPSATENFRTTIGVLRERATTAVYDDRLIHRKSTPERVSVSGGTDATTVKTSSEAGVDLLAHLLAMWLARAAPLR